MLLEFSVRNFRSFRDEQTLSLFAGPGDELQETHTMPIPGSDDERALRSAVIYGPNASGKTNLLLAVDAMRKIVVDSASTLQRGDDISWIEPFRFTEEARNAPTTFRVSFILNDVEHEYEFKATRTEILEEGLYSYPKGRRRRIYKRERNSNHTDGEFEKSPHFGGQKEQIWQATRANALYLSTAAQLNNEDLSQVYDWFRNTLTYLTGRRMTADHPGSTYTARACEDKETRKEILTLLKSADVGIQDLYVEKESSDFPESILEIVESEEFKGKRQQIKEDLRRTIRFQHTENGEEEELLDLNEESHGTQQLFSLAGPILEVLENGWVLLVDEIDSSLHPKMVLEVVGLFNNPETNPHGAQLIFNTHDTTLLDQDVLRRDQIWLTEKFKDGATTLTPLLDFSPRKDSEALEKNYRQGRYGGIPIPRIVEKAGSLQKENELDE
jgi:AAA15 family ATPase/GTPase